MRTAVDSSALWALLHEEPGWESWAEILQKASSEGELVVCPVVFAEMAPSASNAGELHSILNGLGVTYDPIHPRSAFFAGEIFRKYRLSGGPRKSMIPDFLIAAHAQVQAHRLAAIDRGYLRTYFSKLPLLTPDER